MYLRRMRNNERAFAPVELLQVAGVILLKVSKERNIIMTASNVEAKSCMFYSLFL